jgi:hypothetical protein
MPGPSAWRQGRSLRFRLELAHKCQKRPTKKAKETYYSRNETSGHRKLDAPIAEVVFRIKRPAIWISWEKLPALLAEKQKKSVP